MVRVEYLEYELTEDDRPVDPPSVALENSVFVLETVGRVLRFKLKEDFQSVTLAEAKIGQFLRSLQAEHLFQVSEKRRAIRLRRGVDSRGGSSTVMLYGRIDIVGPVADENYRRQHPWEFEFSRFPLANALARRFESHLAGKESLTVVGYFVLTALEHALNGRQGIAQSLSISSKVLQRFSQLVSSVGTFQTARKVSGSLEIRELSDAEKFWLERLVVELIVRLDAFGQGNQPGKRLTNAELP